MSETEVVLRLPKGWMLTVISSLVAVFLGGVVYAIYMDARLEYLEVRQNERTEVIAQLVSNMNRIDNSLTDIRGQIQITNNRLNTMIEVITGRFNPPQPPVYTP